MTLSLKARTVLISSLANKSVGKEIADAIDSNVIVQAASVAAVSAANATDLPTAIALANANKIAINAVIVSLKAAGLMAP
jgi:hypothetical protein